MAILDADKEGFLRSETSLVQTVGRAARNAGGKVIMYADSVTESMENAIRETYRRREIQIAYNKEHGITPQTIKKGCPRHHRNLCEGGALLWEKRGKKMGHREREAMIAKLTAEMKNAAKILEFEHAAYLRDKIQKLKAEDEKPNRAAFEERQEISGAANPQASRPRKCRGRLEEQN